MRVISVFVFVLLFWGCGNSNEQVGAQSGNRDASSEVHGSAPQTTGVIGGTPFVLTGCYEMTLERDTAFLDLQVSDTVVSGKLQYDWNERDGNVGTIKGVLRDSLIIADYTFESEGLMSVREVVFKIEDSTLVQAYGELKDVGGRIAFREPEKLQYINEHPFVKVRCPSKP